MPMGAVVGIFAKETGYGFAFNVAAGSGRRRSLAATVPRDEARKAEGNGEKPRASARRICKSSSDRRATPQRHPKRKRSPLSRPRSRPARYNSRTPA